MGTLQFIKDNLRFLSFGILLTLLSSYGQSFFFGLYNTEIRTTFDLTNTQFGLIYSCVTFFGAMCLAWSGRYIDEFPLRPYVAAVFLLLATGCFIIGIAPVLPVFIIGLFFVRFSAHGLLSHAAGTSMARYFETTRGRAVTISGLGYHIGTIAFPLVIVFLLSKLSWQHSWLLYAASIVTLIIPVVLWLLKDHATRHTAWEQMHNDRNNSNILQDIDNWTQKRVLKDWRFYCLVPLLVTHALIGTAIFFYLENIAEAKSWDIAKIAGSIGFGSISVVVTSLIAGQAIDKLGSLKMLPIIPVPMIAALLCLAFLEGQYVAYLYMLLSGMTTGIIVAAGGSIWAELYGVKHLGSVKALYSTSMVVSTAIMPTLLGYILDRDFHVQTIALGFIGYVVIATILAMPVFIKSLGSKA